MHTIIETNTFTLAAKKLLSDNERMELIETLACNPKAGDLIKGTGGFRKLRLARDNAGKRGGYRAIYYYCNDDIPVFIFTVYAKSEKENLTKLQQNSLYVIAEEYKKYGE